MERAAAGLAVLCVVVAAAALCSVPVHVAKRSTGGLVGRSSTYRPVAVSSGPDQPFDIATIEFEQQPGIRGTARLWWHPGDASEHRGFRVSLKPTSSRDGWSLADEAYFVLGDPRRNEHVRALHAVTPESVPVPIGGFLWDPERGVLTVLAGDTRVGSLRLWHHDYRFVAVRHQRLGFTGGRRDGEFGASLSIRLPDSAADRFAILKAQVVGDVVELELVPWVEGDAGATGTRAAYRVTATKDLKQVIAVERVPVESAR